MTGEGGKQKMERELFRLEDLMGRLLRDCEEVRKVFKSENQALDIHKRLEKRTNRHKEGKKSS